MTKNEARKLAKSAILKMSDAQKEWASGAIVDAISGIEEFTRAHKVFVYLNSSNEPDTQEVVGLALMLERVVCVPRVRGDEMRSIAITPFSNFRTNKWGILEPEGGVDIEDIDVAIIPLVAYDGLNRIGHGKGYYDRYLKNHECLKIGLAFDCQQLKRVEIDEWDVPLDILITEKKIIDCDGVRDNIYGVRDESSSR